MPREGILNRLLYLLWLWCGLRMNWREQIELLTDRGDGNHFYSHTQWEAQQRCIDREIYFSKLKDPLLLILYHWASDYVHRWIWNTVEVAGSIIHLFTFPWHEWSESTETLVGGQIYESSFIDLHTPNVNKCPPWLIQINEWFKLVL